MTENKWTPGPWTVTRARHPTDGEYDYGIGVMIDGRKYCIAETFGIAGPEFLPPAEANARLIAAAPETFEAAEAALACLRHAHDVLLDNSGYDTLRHTINAECRSLAASIAKALGET